MAVKLYKSGALINIEGLDVDLRIINTAQFDWRTSGSSFIIRDGIENKEYNIGAFEDVQNEAGTPFASAAELTTYLNTISSVNTTLVDASGNSNSEQYPLSVDGDSVHAKDIDVSRSELNGFSGEVTDLFNDLHTEIEDVTATNPKIVLVHFHRTIQTSFIGAGSSEGGDFSNTKLIGLLSGGSETVLFDNSGDSTVRTSQPFDIPNTDLNALRIEFHTVNTVGLTNLFINKITSVSAITESKTKYATSYLSPYLLDGASQSMKVDGSSTPVDFIFEYTGVGKASWFRSFIDLQDGAQAFQPDDFGAINTGLANGVDVLVEKGGVETIIENWKTNMDISMTMYDFQSPFKVGAYIGRWTLSSDMGTPIALFKGDKIIVRINDNLTALDAFRFRVKLSQ